MGVKGQLEFAVILGVIAIAVVVVVAVEAAIPQGLILQS